MHPILEIVIKIVSIILRGIFDLIVILFKGISEPRQKSKGSASFMSGSQVRKLLSVWNKGVTINGKDRLSEEESKAHCLLIGQSSTGKTSSVIVPSILNTKSNFIVTDVDGSIYEKVSGKLAKDGYRIQVFHLENLCFSEFFNPVFYCSKDDSAYKQLAKILIEIAYPKATEGSASFWNYGAIQIIYILLKVLKNTPEKYQNLSNVRYLLQRFHEETTKEYISEHASEDTWNEYIGFTGSEESVLSNQITTALVALDIFSDPKLASLMAKNTISFRSLVEDEKSCIFIIVPERKLSYYRGVLSIFYSRFFDYAQEHKSKKTLYCFLDEFGHLTLPNFLVIATTARRYNISLSVVLQDTAQFNARYGDHGASILFNGSFASKILFPGMPVSLARDLSLRFGKTIVKDDNGQTKEKDLLSISDLVQIKNKHSLMVHRNYPAHILKMYPYYESYKLKKLSRIPPAPFVENEFTKPELIPLTQNKDER